MSQALNATTTTNLTVDNKRGIAIVLSDPNTDTKKRRNWEKEVLPYVKEELEKFEKEGVKPTLRTIFYRLASRNIIRNVLNDYTYLSEYTTECRERYVILKKRLLLEGVLRDGLSEEDKQRLYSHGLLIQYNKQRYGPEQDHIILHYISDEYDSSFRRLSNIKKYILKTEEALPVDCFSDETRGPSKGFIDVYKTPTQYIKNSLNFLEDLPGTYKNLIPKWHEQPYYVELWTEKNAMVGTFKSILKGLDVTIVYNRGFDSMSNAWRTYERIKEKFHAEGKKVRILYFGDLDPSGDAMDEIINEKMDLFFNVAKYKEEGLYDFKRVGVLYEHIKEFELLQNQDPEVINKLKNDKRLKQFKKKYHLEKDDDPFQYEIDALAASDPAKFKKMVLDEIRPFYDRQIYESLLSNPNYSEKQISLQN